MSNLRFGRLITAMITPFDKDRNVDLKRSQECAVRQLEGGADALVLTGTTGESPTVFYPDKMDFYKAVIEAVGGKMPLIANVGDNCTADTVSFARDVEKLGIDGLMLVVPYYNKPPQEGLYQHFRTIAEAVDLPIVLYNIPGRCSVNMTAETTLRLANDCENIVAVKEASGKMGQIAQICDHAPDDFVVYSGDDDATLPIMKLGGVGVISTISNVAPGRMKEIIDAFVAGDTARATKLNDRLRPLMKALFATANPILPKAALKLVGFDCGGVRLPLVDATPEQTETLAQVMREVGVLD
jgi:4-hydroxy-tetrahydrodipicolinate synthase